MTTPHAARTAWLVAALAALATSVTACEWMDLDIEPQTILTDDQVWGQPDLITGVIADYYGRLPFHTGFESQDDRTTMAAYDDAIFSGIDNLEFLNNYVEYPYDFDRWNGYNLGNVWIEQYELLRDIHVAMDGIAQSNSPAISELLKQQFTAELRFIRAFVYFELVKRYGGVPLVTEQQIYDFSGDPSALQVPRATEAEVYDFIASELDAIIDQLGNAGSQTRANRYTALALKSRAMLYAGSIARHNSEMSSPITLPGGEVGIPESRAAEYYQASLDASRELINSGAYSLYQGNPEPGPNFYEALTSKTGNVEVIMAVDYDATQGRNHAWTRDMIPNSMVQDAEAIIAGSALSPTLQLVETFDYLDGSSGEMRGVGDGSNTAAGQADWTFYDEIDDIFDGKDRRLYGTVIYPGTSFAGVDVEMQAGVYVWNEGAGKYDRVVGAAPSTYTDGGILTGDDGPVPQAGYVCATGFLIRKHLDSDPGARQTAIDSDVWWVRLRLGEIYLNAAEAAFELGQQGAALSYVNILRERAGFGAGSLTTLTRQKIRDERRVELAFEDHRVWDLKRWRIAHVLWDGLSGSTTANAWALYPYRVVHPGHPNDGKFVYDKIRATRQTAPRHFRLGNYYVEIPGDVVSNNPNIVRNPFH